VAGNEQKKKGHYVVYTNIIYWNEQRQRIYPSSCLFKHFFTQGRNSTITSPNICFSIPIGRCMAEPEDPIVTESILSFERQFSLSKLSINRDSWTTHKPAQRYKGKNFS